MKRYHQFHGQQRQSFAASKCIHFFFTKYIRVCQENSGLLMLSCFSDWEEFPRAEANFATRCTTSQNVVSLSNGSAPLMNALVCLMKASNINSREIIFFHSLPLQLTSKSKRKVNYENWGAVPFLLQLELTFEIFILMMMKLESKPITPASCITAAIIWYLWFSQFLFVVWVWSRNAPPPPNQRNADKPAKKELWMQ